MDRGMMSSPAGRGGGVSGRLSRPALRLLGALARPGAAARPDPTEAGAVMVEAAAGPVTLGGGRHRRAALDELAAADLVAPAPGGRHVASAAGRAHLRRREAGAEGFGAQHRQLEAVVRPGEGGAERLLVNAAESPLDWLRRRRGPDGEPLIDAAAHAAGERLRADIARAGLLPSVTARWDGIAAEGRAGPRDPAGASDAVIAARQRVRHALEAVGGEFADLLLDLCGFLKGLALIEQERGWPPRSAKVVLRLALASLARHYGLEREASGPARSQGLRAWQAEAGA